MKVHLLILCGLAPLTCLSQNTQYNTTINKAQKVEIEDGIVNIKKADTVIFKIFISEKKTFVYLDSLSQNYDTAKKLFITHYYFRNHQSLKTEFEIYIKFNKPVEKCYVNSNGNGTTYAQGSNSKDSTLFYYTGNVVSNTGAALIVESKEIIKAAIKGLDGYFNH